MSHAVIANRHNGALGNSRPVDVVVSADGSKIYASGADGAVRLYDGDSGQLLSTWQLGTKLAGIDLSPDGSFLIVLEAEPVSSTYAQPWWDNRFTVAVYKVDAATGEKTTFLHESTGFEWAFHDVAILADGTALLTQRALPGWSAWVYPEILDTATGVFTTVSQIIRYDTILSDSPAGQAALLGEYDTSDAPLRLYESGTGLTADHRSYRDDVSGFNYGAQALSLAGDLVAQHVPGNGLHIYDSALQYRTNLTGQYPGFGDGIAALAFDSTGEYLFVLDTDADSIVQLATSDWSTVGTFPVGAALTGSSGDYGSRLIVGPNMRYFLVVTDSGLLQIDNPNVSSTIAGTEEDDSLSGTGLYDLIEGLGGDDQLYGLGGNDDLRGGNDQDRLEGGEGDDLLRGDAGDDILVGGAGDDDYSGGDGIDTLDFSGETEVTVNLTSDSGVFSNSPLATRPLNPGEAFDSFGHYEAVSGIENLILTSGGDFAVGGDQANRFEGGAGDDALSGGGGNDVLLGGAGFDGLVGGSGDDAIEGGGDDDELVGGDGDDRLDGGSGIDTAGYGPAASAVTASLALQGIAQDTGGAGIDTLVDIENLFGSTFGDTLIGNDLANVLNGHLGADTMRGADGDDTYFVNDPGDSVEELAGQGVDTIRTSLAVYSLVGLANVENLRTTGPATARDFRGNSGNNVITGGPGSDVLRLQDGGDDTVHGGAGSDNIFFIGSLTSADVVRGGSETDTLVLQGAYGTLALTANITEIENISLLGGGNTAFGEPGTNRHDYVLITHDMNFAAGLQVRINGAALLEGEDFTFDGSAETDARFVVFGGKGRDTLTGGLGHDIFFYAEERFATGDTVNGGAGYDGMFLRGNYTIDFNAPGYTGLFTNIENLTLTSATDERYARGGGSEFDYWLTLSNAIVKPGETLTISGALLMATETMYVDGSVELDGFLRLFGGAAVDTLIGSPNADLIHGNLGGDSLTGRGGADVFRYQSTAESAPVAGFADTIGDFAPGSDKIDLSRIDANSLVAEDQAFTWIGANAFSGTAGELRVHYFGPGWIVEGDVNGDGAADLYLGLLLEQQYISPPPGQGDFIL